MESFVDQDVFDVSGAKVEMFNIALADGDYLTCKAIIEDTKLIGEKGLAAAMEAEIANTPVFEFVAEFAAKN